ncbi:MAG: hypothetical protein WBF77_09690 [Sulfurimonadaceae bacterium]
MIGFEIVAIISVISIFAWFIMAYKNTNSQNQFIEDDTKEKE